MKAIRLVGCGCALLMLATPALAVDSFSVEAGGNSKSPHTTMARVGAQWDWDRKWLTDGAWALGGYWDASIGQWHSSDIDGDHDVLDFGLTPVFRYQKSGAADFLPYVEGAIGFHYLTNTDITRQRRFGTHFQFGSHLGAGFRFGGKGEYDLSYSLQHISNADIEQPNPGIDFHQVRLKYHYR